MSVRASIKGLQKGQDRNTRMIAALRPSGAFYEAIRVGTTMAHRYAVQETPADTGAWRAAHRMSYNGIRGRVYLSPGAKNPRTRGPVRVYAQIYEDRGGSYAVYKRTKQNAEVPIQQAAAAILSGAFR